MSQSHFLTARESHTLMAMCDALVPRLTGEGNDDARLMGVGAVDVNLAGGVERALAGILDDAGQRQVRQLLAIMDTRVFTGLVGGHWRPFSRLPLDARTTVLRAMATHRLAPIRRAFAGLARLSLSTFYSHLSETGTNPTYPVLDYARPERQTIAAAPPVTPVDASTTGSLTCDVLVVGSGAGGGVVASELAAAGHDVLVAEKGDYFADQDFCGKEQDGHQRLYERRGALTTPDGGVLILAGSTLGGGTTINWAGALRPPTHVLQEWERHFGFAGAAGPAFQRSLDVVSQRLGIDPAADPAPNANTRAFEAGLTALDYAVTRIPRNVRDCGDGSACGFCSFGCARGSKQSTLKTFLQDAHTSGARILVRASVDTVVHTKGAVTGARMRVTDATGSVRAVEVQCKAVVLAAGAVHTPAVLLRSGLRNPNIGRHLHVHPTVATSGVFTSPIRAWQGAPMTRLTSQFADLDGAGYGVRLMTAPSHPGMMAFASPWVSGQQHKRVMQRSAHTANIIVVTRDRNAGRVTLDRRGQPRVSYSLAPGDARHMMRGITEALRIHLAAGATEVHSPQSIAPTFRPGGSESLDQFLQRVEGWGLRPYDIPIFSAHQMSSARIAGDARLGVANTSGETYEVRGLFLADGSTLPTCSGVNPMLTILGTAHFLAQRIKERL